MDVDMEHLPENINQLKKLLIDERELLSNKNVEIEIIESFYRQLAEILLLEISKHHLNKLDNEFENNNLSNPSSNIIELNAQKNSENNSYCQHCGKITYRFSDN